MSIRGWVYIITNNAMPGLLKVGYSTKDPKLRANELNNTGSPHPYFVEYDVLVINPREVELKVHGELRNRAEGKEWFRCSINDAIEAVRVVTEGRRILEVTNEQHCDVKKKSLNKAPIQYRDSSYCYGCHALIKFDRCANEVTGAICPKCGRFVGRSQL